MVRRGLGRRFEAKSAHLVLAIPVASGGTASHCDGFSVVTDMGVGLVLGVRGMGGSLCFLTKSKFASITNPDSQSRRAHSAGEKWSR